MATVYVVYFTSNSGGYRGFNTFDSLAEALLWKARREAMGYRVRMTSEQR